MAQSRNVPRNRILKDDALLEIAASRPGSIEALGKSRLLLREARKGDIAEGILAAVTRAEKLPDAQIPRPARGPDRKSGSEALGDLLRVLLKSRAEAEGVAQRLIASSADLDLIASEDAPDVPALRGWRGQVFGQDALRLKRGEIALCAHNGSVQIVEIGADVRGNAA